MTATKTRRSILLLIAALGLALCVALVGCGDNGKYKENFVGTWNLQTLKSNELGKLTGEQLQKMGVSVKLVLNDDGKGELTTGDEQMKISWTVDDKDKITLKIDEGAKSTFELKDGILSSTSGNGQMMAFAKAS